MIDSRYNPKDYGSKGLYIRYRGNWYQVYEITGLCFFPIGSEISIPKNCMLLPNTDNVHNLIVAFKKPTYQLPNDDYLLRGEK